MPTFTLFGDIKRFARSARLEDESVTTVFGDVKLDFTRRPLDPGEQQMRIFSIFGDVRLRIPEAVGIEIDGFTLFGEVEVENLRTGDDEQPGTNYISENFSAATTRARINVFSLFGDIRLLRVATPLAADIADYQERRAFGDGSERVDSQPYEGRTTQLEQDS